MAGGLQLHQQRMDPFTIVSLAGELTLVTRVEAEPYLLATIVAQPPPMHLVLNLTGLRFLDSSGISLIAQANFAVRSTRGTLRMVVPDDSSPRRVLAITGVDQVVKILADLEKALNDGLAELSAPSGDADTGH